MRLSAAGLTLLGLIAAGCNISAPSPIVCMDAGWNDLDLRAYDCPIPPVGMGSTEQTRSR